MAFLKLRVLFELFAVLNLETGIANVCKITASNNTLFIFFALQHTGLKGSIDPLLEEADIDKDGKISLSEFRKLLRTASLSSRGGC